MYEFLLILAGVLIGLAISGWIFRIAMLYVIKDNVGRGFMEEIDGRFYYLDIREGPFEEE